MEKFEELQVREPEYTVRLHDLGSPTRPQEIELKGHEDLVTNIEFSPDGTRLATCSLDRTVRLWDFAELDRLAKARARLRAEPRDRDALIRDFGFDADNFERDLDTTLQSLPKLIGKASNCLRERPQLLLGDDAMMQNCQLSTDGTWLVAAGHRPTDEQTCARLWSTGALTACAAPVRLSYEAPIDNFQLNQTMAISPDQRWLIILQDCSQWEFHLGSEGAVLPVRLVQSGSFSANVARFSNASDLLVLNVNKAVIMFRMDEDPSSPPRFLDTGEQDTRLGFFTPDDRWFVAACGKNVVGEPMDVRLWRPHEIDESGSPLIVLEDARQLGECEASPGGRWLTAWDHDAGYVWDLRRDDPHEGGRTLRGHQAKINTVLFSADERFLISAGADGQLLGWDLLAIESTIEPRVLHADPSPLVSVVADRERNRLFIGGNAGHATILTLDNQLSIIETRDFGGMSGPVSAVFDPTGRGLAARDKQGVRIFDAATGEQNAELLDDPGIQHLRPQFGYSPDGRWLIVSRQGRIFLIAVQPGAQRAPVELLGHHHEEITFRVTRDSHWLVTSDRAIDEPQGYQPVQTCRIWDLQSPDPAASSVSLPDMPRGVDRTVITGDDRWLVTSSRDGVRLWPLGTQHLIEIGQRSIGREPNDEERRRYAFTAAALQGIE
jgi:WD40 repeat protein